MLGGEEGLQLLILLLQVFEVLVDLHLLLGCDLVEVLLLLHLAKPQLHVAGLEFVNAMPDLLAGLANLLVELLRPLGHHPQNGRMVHSEPPRPNLLFSEGFNLRRNLLPYRKEVPFLLFEF